MLSIKVLGVRGSFPLTQESFLRYGGNTSCFEVRGCGDVIAFDAGSGLSGITEGKRVHILLGHLHLDHLIGLFNFPLLSDPEAEIHIYGATWDGTSLRSRLDTLMSPPFWPVTLAEFSARVYIHPLDPGVPFSLSDGITVSSIPSHHPNGGLIYRLESEGKSIVYALDYELVQDRGPLFEELVLFARGADLLIWDASFTSADMHNGWGHSTWQQGISLKQTAGAKQILMSHYSCSYTDEFLEQQEALASAADRGCLFAKEGMEVSL